MKPLMYLDVDDTLLMCRSKIKAAPGAAQFLYWVTSHFEVWWLSMWCPGGPMLPERQLELSKLLGVPVSAIAEIPAARFWFPGGWYDSGGPYRDKVRKTDGIDWAQIDAGREWVWIEDGLIHAERTILRERKASLRHIPCNVTANPRRLQAVAGLLEKRFGLPQCFVPNIPQIVDTR